MSASTHRERERQRARDEIDTPDLTTCPKCEAEDRRETRRGVATCDECGHNWTPGDDDDNGPPSGHSCGCTTYRCGCGP